MRRLLALLALSCTQGCAALLPIPDLRTPADRAHALDPSCRGESDATAAPVVSAGAIDSVEAYSTRIPASNGHENRMLGARVHLRPLAGATRESLQRALQCHQARVVLGTSPPAQNDPYAFRGHWLAIDVDSEGNGFVASVYPIDFHQAKEELERARSFVRTRP